MIVAKISKGDTHKKGPWFLVHGPLVLARQIHSGVISFGFDADVGQLKKPLQQSSDQSDEFFA